MASARKFLFDVSFDQVAAKPAPPEPPPPPPEEKFTRAELEAAQEAARAEGHSAGLAEANTGATARAAAALEILAGGVKSLLGTIDAARAQTQREAIEALRLITAKVLPAAATKGALSEIESFAAKSLIDALDEPRVVLRVASELYEPVRGQLETIAAASGFDGRIVLLADDTLTASDARLEWADGGVERDTARLLRDADAAMARSCDPAATPIPPSPPGDNP
jgi:flagellar assembly protein FliH